MENSIDTKDREIQMSRTLNAPVALVWEMWTTPEHIVNWWGPNGFTNTISQMDVKPGGEWHLMMHGPDGTDYQNKSKFEEVILHKKLVFSHMGFPWATTTVEFEEQGEKTHINWRMVFQSVEVFQKVVKEHKAIEGMKQNVEKLERYLEGRAD
jgi:uncharacterized protein YndB with AHSA1/START domain